MCSSCKYCGEIENRQENPGLRCIMCQNLVHLKCLVRPGTPGDFAGDVFFDYTCADCSEDGSECFVRNKMPWVNAILLTIHHLTIQAHGISHHGFFHYKTHVASFIDRHWQLLFGTQVKQKKNWMGTIAGTLSVYNGLLFRSGSDILGETGWWKLRHYFSPALAAYIITEIAKDRSKTRSRGQLGTDKSLFYAKVKALGVTNYLVEENEAPDEPTPKKPRLVSDSESELRLYDQDGRSTSDIEPKSEPENSILDDSFACLSAGAYDVDGFFSGYEFAYQEAHTSEHNDSSSSRTHTTHTLTDAGAAADDTDHSPHSPHSPRPPDHSDDPEERPAVHDARPRHARRKNNGVVVRRESLFSSLPNSVDMPWQSKEESQASKDLVELSEYEEVQLLKQVEGLLGKVRDGDRKAYLHRLRAKLALRRIKRHKHLPIFDLDKTVRVLGGYVSEAPRAPASVECVLDRFQRSYLMDSLTGTVAESGGGLVLLPPGAEAAAALRSPYSGALLKPYIRRDTDTRPLWLRLTDELLRKTNSEVAGARARAPLDYSYVRPQHIPAVNSLCAQFFWPGIDLTEALQHPEFSCVVSYGKLVVACAFLVPDARAAGGMDDAYISFVLTRPEWRRAGIATFMLYHLLQTCTGKDVTLHVSPTNPAIFLYQKFGFKVEELVQDFYEKYYDIDHKGCRHALFLRLIR